MIKTYIVLALFVALACAQQEPASAPEPYSYGYETDSHAAAEQRDPNGKVTGYYTLVDADGRSRRVEYFADETGFHAKVQTNELGTKAESPADVELLASPPTAEQLVYQAPPQVAYQQVVSSSSTQQQIPLSYSYQQPGYAYGSGYSYGPASYSASSPYYGYGYGAGYGAGYGTGYGTAYGTGYGASYNSVYGGYGAPASRSFSSYAPASYYRTISTSQPSGYYQYAQPASYYRTVSGYRSATGPTITYQQSSPQVSSSQVVQTVPSSSYQILKK